MFSTLNKTYQRLIHFISGLLVTIMLSLITSHLAIAQVTLHPEIQPNPETSQATVSQHISSSSAFQEVAASHLQPNFYP